MPLALLVALFGSLLIHGLVLFGDVVALPGEPLEQAPLRAELRPPPAEAPVAARPPAKPPVKRKRSVLPAPAPVLPVVNEKPAAPPLPPAEVVEAARPDEAAIAAPPSVTPRLPANGVIRFAISKVSLGLQIGRAEHRWTFGDDGSYVLHGITETSGLASLIRPLRQESISRGRLTGRGLQPDSFRSLRNGKDTGENADFDWSTGVVTLQRDGSQQDLSSGAQDILSLNYQLAYLPHPEDGSRIGVVTGKKYETYALDALGEEAIETPAGRFRTLHLRAQSTTVTEIWMALDPYRLPVKIRFTDRKGDQYEQVATEIGTE